MSDKIKMVTAELVDDPDASRLPELGLSKMIKSLPSGRGECLTYISESLLEVTRFTAIKHWDIGRVIHHMESRGEKQVVEEIANVTGYKKRAVQYAKAVFIAFPDIEFVAKLCKKGLSWSDLRKLLAIPQQEARLQVANKFLTGEADKEEMFQEMEEILQSDKSTEPDTDTGEKKEAPVTVRKYFSKLSVEVLAAYEKMHMHLLDLEQYLEMAEDEDRTSDAQFEAAQKEAASILRGFQLLMQEMEEARGCMVNVFPDLGNK